MATDYNKIRTIPSLGSIPKEPIKVILENYNPEPAVINLRDTNGVLISTDTAKNGEEINITAPDATINVVDQNSNPLATLVGKSNSTTTQEITVESSNLEEILDDNTVSDIADTLETVGKDVTVRDQLIKNQTGGTTGILQGLTFGSSLSTPRGMDWMADNLYVANAISNNLVIFNTDNKAAAPSVVTGFPTGFSKVTVDGTYILGVGSTNTTNSIQVRSFASPSTTLQTISYGARTYSCALIGGVAYVGALLTGEIKKYNPATGAQIDSAIATSNTGVRAILPHTNGTQYWVLTSNGALGTVELRNLSDDSLASSFSVNGGTGLNTMVYCNGNLCITYNQATGPSFLRGYSTAGVLQYSEYLATLNCFGLASTGNYLMYSKDAYNELANLIFVA